MIDSKQFLFTESERAIATNRRILREQRIAIMVEAYDSQALSEAKIYGTYASALIDEAIAYERDVIVETFSRMSTDDIIETYFTFKTALATFLKKLGAGEAYEQLQQIVAYGDDAMDLLQRDVDVHGAYRDQIVKVFTDVATIVKGLFHVAVQIDDESTPLGKTFVTAQSLAGDKPVSMIAVFRSIDNTSGDKQPRSMWGKLKDKISGTTGQGSAAKFRDEILRTFRSYASGMQRIVDLDDIATAMMQKTPQQLGGLLDAFYKEIQFVADDEMLADILKQKSWLSNALGDIWSKVKGYAGVVKGGVEKVKTPDVSGAGARVRKPA